MLRPGRSQVLTQTLSVVDYVRDFCHEARPMARTRPRSRWQRSAPIARALLAADGIRPLQSAHATTTLCRRCGGYVVDSADAARPYSCRSAPRRSRRLAPSVAELSARTFCTFRRELSSLRGRLSRRTPCNLLDN